ncbi:hypothetical protein ACLOJK_005558 [Asimina triloba]
MEVEVMELPTNEDAECAFETRVVLDLSSRYDRALEENTKVVKELSESFGKEKLTSTVVAYDMARVEASEVRKASSQAKALKGELEQVCVELQRPHGELKLVRTHPSPSSSKDEVEARGSLWLR